jgi:head-tail adaptor
MTAGRRDQLVTLQAYTTTQDEYGEEVQTWADSGAEWAAVFYGKGDERRQAAMEQGEQAATFQMLSNTQTRALTVTDRIVLGGVNWDIRGIAPETPKRGLIEFAATRSA